MVELDEETSCGITPDVVQIGGGGAVAVVTVASAGAASAAPPTDPGAAKIAPQVRAQIADGKQATFLVTLADQADLGPARRAKGKARATEVYRAKTAHADRSQAGLRRMLTGRKAAFTPYWIANTIKVTGDEALLRAVAARPEVTSVTPDSKIRLEPTLPAKTEAAVGSVEWNVDRVGAPRVWDEFGADGTGIVVANIDSGVQYDHPALAASYRGRQADGSYDHNYNWFDPTGVCPAGTPCDNVNHGTHTMGTMVGRDGTHTIGVAPGARWIAAKGCETAGCSDSFLLDSGQWILAPTDLNGQNPRPDLAPDVVNNSWGGGLDNNVWYRETVEAWTTAGIFPAYAIGNLGSSCRTTNPPGSYDISYATGAFDIDNAIARFSSRGVVTGTTQIKPDIAAPGVNIRSSVPNGEYRAISGTSMASPHTAAAVALLWSAVPELRRDLARTRQLLSGTASDVADTTCGGTAERNNVWGEGRLDVYSAVAAAKGPTGTATATVTVDGTPTAGHIVAVSGRSKRLAATAADGTVRIDLLPPGEYTVTVKSFGFTTFEGSVTVTPDKPADLTIGLVRKPTAILSGTLTWEHNSPAGATVTAAGTPVSTKADADGRYRMELPQDPYTITVAPASLARCAVDSTQKRVDVTGDTTLDFAVAKRSDEFGYTCGTAVDPYTTAGTPLDFTKWGQSKQIDLPFEFPFYGNRYTKAWVNSSGFVNFGDDTLGYLDALRPFPSPKVPNATAYAYWKDFTWYLRGHTNAVYHSSTDDTFVVEWRTMEDSWPSKVSMNAVFHRNGMITYQYKVTGTQASPYGLIGIENATGTDGFLYGRNTSGMITDGLGFTYYPPSATPAE